MPNLKPNLTVIFSKVFVSRWWPILSLKKQGTQFCCFYLSVSWTATKLRGAIASPLKLGLVDWSGEYNVPGIVELASRYDNDMSCTCVETKNRSGNIWFRVVFTNDPA